MRLTSVSDLLAPATVLEFSDDLRVVDIGPLQIFLAARFGELAALQAPDSDARWGADRLASVTDAACRDLEDALVLWQNILTEGRTQEPGVVQALRDDLGFDWNRLIETAARFAAHPQYRPRWRPLRYVSVEHAEYVELSDGMQHGGLDGDGAHP